MLFPRRERCEPICCESLSVSGVPGVDKARGPRAERTSQHRRFNTFPLPSSSSPSPTQPVRFPSQPQNPSSASPTRISPTLSLPFGRMNPPFRAHKDCIPERYACMTTRESIEYFRRIDANQRAVRRSAVGDVFVG